MINNEKTITNNEKTIKFDSNSFISEDINYDYIESRISSENLQSKGILGPIKISGVMQYSFNVFKTQAQWYESIKDDKKALANAHAKNKYLKSTYQKDYYEASILIPKENVGALYVLAKATSIYKDKTGDNSTIEFKGFNKGELVNPYSKRTKFTPAVNRDDIEGYVLGMKSDEPINVFDLSGGKRERIETYKYFVCPGMPVTAVVYLLMTNYNNVRRLVAYVRSLSFNDCSFRRFMDEEEQKRIKTKKDRSVEFIRDTGVYDKLPDNIDEELQDLD